MERRSRDFAPDTSCCRVEDRRIPGLLIDNVLRRLFRPPERFLSEHLSSGNAAADLGCGPGFFTLPMAKIVGSDGVVHAVDFDPKAVDRVAAKASRLAYGGSIVARAASASQIDFIESGSIDFVLAEGLLCCMKDHAGAVRQIKRILKPNGRAYLSVIKFGREGDPRSVSKEEWSDLLAEFLIVDGGERAVSRWALVAQNADGGNTGDEEIDAGRTLDPVRS